MQFPELETSRLKLTGLIDNDAQGIFELFSDESVTKYYNLEAFDNLAQAKN